MRRASDRHLATPAPAAAAAALTSQTAVGAANENGKRRKSGKRRKADQALAQLVDQVSPNHIMNRRRERAFHRLIVT